MKRPIIRSIVLSVCLFAVVGCDDDPADGGGPADFAGDWVLVSTIVQKKVCPGGQLADKLIEELTISQTEDQATLDFEGFSVSGAVVDNRLIGSGTLPGDETVELNLRMAGSRLEGSVQIDGDGCQEERAVVATRRVPDADFSGHWNFELTVVGEGGCSHIVDYSDCFGIIQSGRDLLVVDEEAGNLFGSVTGNIAEIERDTLAENTWLIFYLNEAEDRLTGTAFRVFTAEACRSDLEFVGLKRDGPCSNPKH